MANDERDGSYLQQGLWELWWVRNVQPLSTNRLLSVQNLSLSWARRAHTPMTSSDLSFDELEWQQEKEHTIGAIVDHNWHRGGRECYFSELLWRQGKWGIVVLTLFIAGHVRELKDCDYHDQPHGAQVRELLTICGVHDDDDRTRGAEEKMGNPSGSKDRFQPREHAAVGAHSVHWRYIRVVAILMAADASQDRECKPAMDLPVELWPELIRLDLLTVYAIR